MKPPVLVAGPASYVHPIEAALEQHFTVTIVEELERARALVGIGAFSIVVAAGPFRGAIEGAMELPAIVDHEQTLVAVRAAAARATRAERNDTASPHLAALPYDEYIELARYAATRRYLIGLLHHHRGSVTDAAKTAGLVRESLHRLLRRHHVEAETFRAD